MEIKTAAIRGGLAQWQVFGDAERARFVFLPANGFPVGSYRFLLDVLAQQHGLLAFESRGAWPDKSPPKVGFNWAAHADDLIAFLDYQCTQGDLRPVTAVGHSIGATVSAMAARKRPDLFERLVLIDPATLPGRWIPMMMRLMPSLAERMDLVTRTRGRRVHWKSREEFASYHRSKSAYKRFSEQALADYAHAALRAAEQNLELVYSRDWEAWNFQHTATLWPQVRKLTLPTLVLRGEHSYLHPEADFQRHCRRLPANVEARTVPGAGHMLPQEAPDAVLAAIADWLP